MPRSLLPFHTRIARLGCNGRRINPRCIMRVGAAIGEREDSSPLNRKRSSWWRRGTQSGKPPRTVDSGAVFLITMDCPVFEPFV